MTFLNYILSKILVLFLRLLVFFHPFIPNAQKKHIIIFDNITNKNCLSLENFNLFKTLYKFNNVKVFYLANGNLKLNYDNPNIIYLNSNFLTIIRLFRVFLFARMIIDSYQQFYRLGLTDFYRLKSVITIYSQHGLNYFKSSGLDNCLISNDFYDYCILSSEKEKSLFLNKYLYSSNQLKVIGLARLIGSHKTNLIEDHSVFIYLTRRDYFYSDRRLTSSFIVKTKELCLTLRQAGFNVNLALHHTVPSNLRDQFSGQLVSESNIEEIKRKSKILITDFSSIFFDVDPLKYKLYFYLPDYKYIKDMKGSDYENIKNTLRVLSKKDISFSTEQLLCKIKSGLSYDLKELKIIHSSDEVKTGYVRLIHEILNTDSKINDTNHSNNFLNILETKNKLLLISENCSLDFSSPNDLYLTGFYPSEINKEGDSFRWSNNDSHIYFKLSPGFWFIRLKVYFDNPKKLKSYFFYCNDKKINSFFYNDYLTFKLRCVKETKIDLRFFSNVSSDFKLNLNEQDSIFNFEREMGMAVLKINFLKFKQKSYSPIIK